MILTSRTYQKCLVVNSRGEVQCTGSPRNANALESQFEVVGSQYSPKAIRFRSVAYPHFYLAIMNGYFLGNVRMYACVRSDMSFM